MFGSIFLLSQYLQTVLGYSPTEAGRADAALDRHADARRARSPAPSPTASAAARSSPWAWPCRPSASGSGALVVEPDVSYTAQLPALIICGIGMAHVLRPQPPTWSWPRVRPEEQGIASGANNAIREVGGAIGVASLAAVFSAQGGYESASTFVDGLIPALWVGAGAVALAAAVTFLMPRPAQGRRPGCRPLERNSGRAPAAI